MAMVTAKERNGGGGTHDGAERRLFRKEKA
jgi:hypothetical protein